MPTLEDDKVIVEVTKFAVFQTVVGITDLDDLPDGDTFGRVLNTQLTGNKISSLGLGSSPGSTPITIDTFGLTTVGNAPNPAGSGWTARGLDHISVQEAGTATGIWGLLGGTDFGVWIGKGGIGGGDYSLRTIDLNSVGIDLLAAKSLNVKASGSINFESGGSILADNNADIPITVSGTGKVDITDPALSIGGADYTFPSEVGAASTVLTTDGSNPGVLSWSTFSGVANPLTSNLDVATFSIVSTAGRDLTLDTDGVGTLVFTKGEAQAHRIQFVSTALSAQEVEMRFQNFFTGLTSTDGGLIAMTSLGEFRITNQETGGANLTLRVSGNGSDINFNNASAFQTDVIIVANASQESRLVLAPSNSTSTDKNFQFLTTFASDQLSIGSSTNPDIIKIINGGTVTFTPPTAVTGVLIDQDNDAISLDIDSESTTASVIQITAAATNSVIDINVTSTGATILDLTNNNTLTTGGGFALSSNSMTTGQGVAVTISTATYTGTGAIVGTVSGASSTGAAIFAQHFGTGNSLTVQHIITAGRALFVDQDTDGISIDIDSESTTVTVFNIDSVSTTGDIIKVIGNSLTTGNGLSLSSSANRTASIALGFISDTGATNAGTVLQLTQDGASATGIVLGLKNDGIGNGLFINQDGNGIALNIDSESTTVNVIQVTADALTTGSAAEFCSDNSGFTTSNGLVKINIENASASGTALKVRNDGTGNGILIDQNGNGIALNIDGEETSQIGINANFDTMTTGRGLVVSTDSASFTQLGLAFFRVDNVSASGHVVLIQNDGTGNGVLIDQNGNSSALVIDSEATSAITLDVVVDALTSGTGIRVFCNSSGFTATGGLLNVFIDNASASGTGLRVRNDGTGLIVDFTDAAVSIFKIADGGIITLGTTAMLRVSNRLVESSPSNGDIWYDTTANAFKGFENGVEITFDTT